MLDGHAESCVVEGIDSSNYTDVIAGAPRFSVGHPNGSPRGRT